MHESFNVWVVASLRSFWIEFSALGIWGTIGGDDPIFGKIIPFEGEEISRGVSAVESAKMIQNACATDNQDPASVTLLAIRAQIKGLFQVSLLPMQAARGCHGPSALSTSLHGAVFRVGPKIAIPLVKASALSCIKKRI